MRQAAQGSLAGVSSYSQVVSSGCSGMCVGSVQCVYSFPK